MGGNAGACLGASLIGLVRLLWSDNQRFFEMFEPGVYRVCVGKIHQADGVRAGALRSGHSATSLVAPRLWSLWRKKLTSTSSSSTRLANTCWVIASAFAAVAAINCADVAPRPDPDRGRCSYSTSRHEVTPATPVQLLTLIPDTLSRARARLSKSFPSAWSASRLHLENAEWHPFVDHFANSALPGLTRSFHPRM